MDGIPIVFIATKSDLDLVAQRSKIQPDAYCRSLGLSVPMNISLTTSSRELFRMLVGVCMQPNTAVVGIKGGWSIGVLGVGVVVVGVFLGIGVWARWRRI